MTPLRDEYRDQAAYAMDMADLAPSDELKADWLRLARKWLGMIPHRTRSPKELFEDGIRRNATGQENSDASH